MPDRRPVTGSQAPVVFMFHGSSGTAPQFLRISGWREQADATGLIAVFPQGLRYRILENGRLSTKWNDYTLASQVDLTERPGGYPESSPWPADDVGFVDSDHVRPARGATDRSPPRLCVRLLERRSLHGPSGGRALGQARGGRLLRRRLAHTPVAGPADPDVPHARKPRRPGARTDRPAAADRAAAQPVRIAGGASDRIDPDDPGERRSGSTAATSASITRPHSTSLRWPATRHRPQRRPVPLLPARRARAQVRKRAQQPRRLRGGAASSGTSSGRTHCPEPNPPSGKDHHAQHQSQAVGRDPRRHDGPARCRRTGKRHRLQRSCGARIVRLSAQSDRSRIREQPQARPARHTNGIATDGIGAWIP